VALATCHRNGSWIRRIELQTDSDSVILEVTIWIGIRGDLENQGIKEGTIGISMTEISTCIRAMKYPIHQIDTSERIILIGLGIGLIIGTLIEDGTIAGIADDPPTIGTGVAMIIAAF
jgi:hypothetical protein